MEHRQECVKGIDSVPAIFKTPRRSTPMLKRVLLTGPLVFAFVLAFALPVHADPISYYAIMIGANEVPPVGTSASGLSLITLNGNLLTINVSFSGLTGGPA